MKSLFLRGLATALALLLSATTAAAAGAGGAAARAQGPVQVDDAWVRASVPGQSGTGAFMRLTAREPLTLVAVRTPAASAGEIHEMRLDGDVMRMRAITQMPLPAGQAVDLRPGGHHLMLMNLKAPLTSGARVPLTLVLRDAHGAEVRVDLQVPVSLRAPGTGAAAAASAPAHSHGAHPGMPHGQPQHRH